MVDVLLTIAGSDPSGGAGVEADSKVFTLHGCYATSVTTALTCQNTQGVSRVHVVPPDFVGECLDAVADDFTIKAIKVGMLADPETVKAVGAFFERYTKSSDVHIIVDPVMGATSGSKLLGPKSDKDRMFEAYKTHVFPYATVITPNIIEAEEYLDWAMEGTQPDPREPRHSSVEYLVRLACLYNQHSGSNANILIKGGHMPIARKGLPNELAYARDAEELSEQVVVDVLLDQTDASQRIKTFVNPYVDAGGFHGTGCNLSSLIAAFSSDVSIPFIAIREAIYSLGAAIAQPFYPSLGKGNGPVNALLPTNQPGMPPYAVGSFADYMMAGVSRDDSNPSTLSPKHLRLCKRLSDFSATVRGNDKPRLSFARRELEYEAARQTLTLQERLELRSWFSRTMLDSPDTVQSL